MWFRDDSHQEKTTTADGKAPPPASKPAKEVTAPQQPLASDPSAPVWQGMASPPAPPLGVTTVKPQEEPPGHRIGQILEPALWMVCTLLIAAAFLMIVQALRKRSQATRDTLQEQLTQFRDAYQKGQMSKEEYHRVHALLTARLKENIKTAEDPSANASDEPSPAKRASAGESSKSEAATQENPAQDNGQA